MGTKPCSICSNPARAAIDLCLVNGTSVRDTAQQFGLSASAVQRHKTTCMTRTVPAITAPVQVPAYATTTEAAIAQQNITSISQRAESLVGRMEQAFDECQGTGDYGILVRCSKEVREGLKLLAQLSGELGPNNQINLQVNNVAPSLMQSPEWPVLMRVLSAHPEIKAELMAALTEAGL
jgi:hypothetical protein